MQLRVSARFDSLVAKFLSSLATTALRRNGSTYPLDSLANLESGTDSGRGRSLHYDSVIRLWLDVAKTCEILAERSPSCHFYGDAQLPGGNKSETACLRTAFSCTPESLYSGGICMLKVTTR